MRAIGQRGSLCKDPAAVSACCCCPNQRSIIEDGDGAASFGSSFEAWRVVVCSAVASNGRDVVSGQNGAPDGYVIVDSAEYWRGRRGGINGKSER